MNFHWSLSDIKSPEVSGTLLRILSDLNKFGLSPPVPLFPSPPVFVLREPITIGIIVTFMFHGFFQIPSKVEVFIPLFAFFQFYYVVRRDSKVYKTASSHFFVVYYEVWSSGRDYESRLYLKIPEEFIIIIIIVISIIIIIIIIIILLTMWKQWHRLKSLKILNILLLKFLKVLVINPRQIRFLIILW